MFIRKIQTFVGRVVLAVLGFAIGLGGSFYFSWGIDHQYASRPVFGKFDIALMIGICICVGFILVITSYKDKN